LGWNKSSIDVQGRLRTTLNILPQFNDPFSTSWIVTIAANKEANKHTKTYSFMTLIYLTALSAVEIKPIGV